MIYFIFIYRIDHSEITKMAENRNTNIIDRILENLNELSSRISPQTSAETEAEVSHIFNSNTARRRSTSVVPTTNTTEQNVPRRSFVTRRNFNTQRPSASNRRQIRESKRRPGAIDNRPFLRDLILLGGPNASVVPRQGARLALMERGHMISGCRFTKAMNAAQVEIAIMEAFADKIPAGVDIEILMSMHTSLVVPSLAHGQIGIDGAILQRLFQSKPVYVRPNKQIIIEHQENVCTRKSHDDLPDIFGDVQMSISSTDANQVPLALPQDTAQSPFSLPQETAQASLQSTSDLHADVVQDTSAQSPFSLPQETAQTSLQSTTDLHAVGVQNTSAQSPFSPPQETAQTSLQSTTDLHAVGVQDTSVMQEIHLVDEDDDFMFQNHPKLKEVIVHRSMIRHDIIDVFKDPEFLSTG
ncbi:uncharacterized protein LOC124453576 isoform X3 [Xenia sp. Carnegie-2017]|uniref:uncharacterized protein LOC124453576 isoform X3 n=1 Tax=Xenia sp. Carnegie-2017 TaxID=2897299 RepID=UPI001F04DA48|nr:uncharacterized protein LOC124453576 isoform X3 [Xenia sp. Carnegie-2017]